MENTRVLLDKGSSWMHVLLSVTEFGLTWKYEVDSIYTSVSLPINQILNSEIKERKDNCGIKVDFVKVIVTEDSCVTLKHDAVTFWGSQSFVKETDVSIHKLLKDKEHHRPRRILVFVNPISGWMNSESVYKHTVLPIFEVCRCHVTTIHTEHKDHARQFLLNEDLSAYNVIVSVGGDGTFKEIVCGLLERVSNDVGVDMDDENSPITKPSIPVASIPCGSGMALAHALNNTKDAETAVISIVLGKTTPADVTSIRNENNFVGYGIIMQEIGIISNVMPILDSMRWFSRKARYFFFVPILWWIYKIFDIRVEYKPVPETEKEFRLADGLDTKIDTAYLTRFNDGPKPGWKTYSSTASNMMVLNYKLHDFIKSIRKPATPYKKPDMSSGKALMCWTTKTNFKESVSCLRIPATEGRAFTPPSLIHQEEVTECKVTSKQSWSSRSQTCMCQDGDVLLLPYGPNIHLKIHEACVDMICIDDELVSVFI